MRGHDRLPERIVQRIYRSLCFFVSSLAFGQGGPTFGVTTRLVLTDVLVTERQSGRVVSDLTATDFVIRDEGELRAPAFFDAGGSVLDAVLVIDTSAGVSRDNLNDISTPLHEIIAQFHPGDRLGVVSFSEDSAVRTRLTDDPDVAERAVLGSLGDRIRAKRTARIYKALAVGAGLFEGRRKEERRRVLIVLTHNRERSSLRGNHATTDAVLEADATLVAFVVPQLRSRGGAYTSGGVAGGPIWRRERDTKPVALADLHTVDPLAEVSGGELVRLSGSNSDVHRTFQRLRSRYTLGFYSPALAKRPAFRRIQVDLSDNAKLRYPPLALRYRSGYSVE